MNERTLTEILRKIIRQETVYLRHYYAQITNVVDPLRLGRVCVTIPEIDGPNKAGTWWCCPRDKSGITTPKNKDWIEVYFMNGDRNLPAYIGEAIEMENMLPKNYKKKATSQVIFEDPENSTHIVFDADANAMEIGNSNFKAVARVDDTVQLNLTAVDIQALAVSLLSTTGFTPASAPVPATVPMPAVTGLKITSGSSQIKIGDK